VSEQRSAALAAEPVSLRERLLDVPWDEAPGVWYGRLAALAGAAENLKRQWEMPSILTLGRSLK
jgi:hypothetical protein